MLVINIVHKGFTTSLKNRKKNDVLELTSTKSHKFSFIPSSTKFHLLAPSQYVFLK